MDDLAQSMDFCSITNHSRTIIHIDIDCFYAQVEMLKNPALRECPLGIQQKNIIVTSNYPAREYGIQKCMLVSEGLQLCPQLVLVRGEDLTDYREMSTKVTNVLQKFSLQVEKLGLDENYVDVTHLVSSRLGKTRSEEENVNGHVYGNLNENCDCDCKIRLCVGSYIAREMRNELKNSLGITTCAGIAHNKLLAKLVCAVHKPNQQTTVFPCSSLDLLSSLQNVRGIPGIGHRMYETLQTLGILNVAELRNSNLLSLQKVLGKDVALHIKELSYGIDDSPVRQTGKPQSIGLEDGFRKICLESEVKDKLATLLHRLLKLLSQDGRIPGSIRVTVRKYDTSQKCSHRESRQCNISAALFMNSASSCEKEIGLISPKSNGKLIYLIMQLFHKMVDITKPFHLTLLGLAFTKFQERKTGKSSIASFLTNDISVQSVLNFKSALLQSEKMECASVSSSLPSMEKSGSESEPEPSPKKTRKDFLFPRCKKRLSSEEDEIVPNKRLSEMQGPEEDYAGSIYDNVFHSGAESPMEQANAVESTSYETVGKSCSTFLVDRTNSNLIQNVTQQNVFQIPDHVDQDVFNALPQELKSELLEIWRKEKKETSPVSHSKEMKLNAKPKQKSILQYFIKNK